MKKETLTIILSVIMAAAIATAFVIIHKPLPRPDALTLRPKIYLNDSLSNALSDIPETENIDKRIRAYNIGRSTRLNSSHAT